jgi:hypothetical protein
MRGFFFPADGIACHPGREVARLESTAAQATCETMRAQTA